MSSVELSADAQRAALWRSRGRPSLRRFLLPTRNNEKCVECQTSMHSCKFNFRSVELGKLIELGKFITSKRPLNLNWSQNLSLVRKYIS